MTAECDPTNTDIEIEPVKLPVEQPEQPILPESVTEVIWTIDGPRPVIEICWGLRKLSLLEDF